MSEGNCNSCLSEYLYFYSHFSLIAIKSTNGIASNSILRWFIVMVSACGRRFLLRRHLLTFVEFGLGFVCTNQDQPVDFPRYQHDPRRIDNLVSSWLTGADSDCHQPAKKIAMKNVLIRQPSVLFITLFRISWKSFIICTCLPIESWWTTSWKRASTSQISNSFKACRITISLDARLLRSWK